MRKYVKLNRPLYHQEFDFNTKQVVGLCNLPKGAVGEWVEADLMTPGHYRFDPVQGTTNNHPYCPLTITPTVQPFQLPSDAEYYEAA